MMATRRPRSTKLSTKGSRQSQPPFQLDISKAYLDHMTSAEALRNSTGADGWAEGNEMR